MRSLPQEPAAAWHAQSFAAPLSDVVGAGEVIVTYDTLATGAFASRRLADAVAALVRSGARLFRLVGELSPQFNRALADLAEAPVFVSRSASAATSRLPSGPEVILVGDSAWRLPPPPAQPRVLFLPINKSDPDRPGEGLLDRYNGAVLTLDVLLERLTT